MTDYFYDSYAILEYINGNESYLDYFVSHDGVTTLYNAMEVYYSVLLHEGSSKAKKVLALLGPLLIYPTLSDIIPAMHFRLRHKKKRLSYADCLGYILARRHKLSFLTGDEGFRLLPSVTFLK